MKYFRSQMTNGMLRRKFNISFNIAHPNEFDHRLCRENLITVPPNTVSISKKNHTNKNTI